MGVNVEDKVNQWKNKLLDLGKRNKLLNFKETKRGTLRFVTPSIAEIYDYLVVKGKTIEFPLVNEDNEESVVEVFKPKKNRFVVTTNQTPQEQQKSLRYIRSKARSINEEQGVNVLYLSFGFLSWNEKMNGELFDAPLILVPVTIQHESIVSPFRLSMIEDEILINPTLRYKMENDYNFKFPDFNEDSSITEFLQKVEQMVASKQWQVRSEVCLGMLSFLKINMYHDLADHKQIIQKHPIVRTIAGDLGALDQSKINLDKLNLDKDIVPQDSFQVVDADASQQMAIQYAKEGMSFVLQGPPGTGKSQTITNIIAERLAQGKRVLFVSEKMAALDVVHHRLTNAKLDDFCLVLHSNKANKREILDQLNRSLELGLAKEERLENNYHELTKLYQDRVNLDAYATEINEVIQPLNKSVYEVNGILAELEPVQDVIFKLPAIKKVSYEDLEYYCELLAGLADQLKGMSYTPENNPWRHTTITRLSNELRNDLLTKIPEFTDKIAELESHAASISDSLYLPQPKTIEQARNLSDFLLRATTRKEYLLQWLLTSDISKYTKPASKNQKLQSRFYELVDVLKQQLEKMVSIDQAYQYEGQVEKCTKDDVKQLDSWIRSLISNDSSFRCWNGNASLYDEFQDTYEHAQKIVLEYLDAYERITNDFDPAIIKLPYEEIYFRFKASSDGLFKIFNRSYREDRKTIQAYSKKSEKLTDEQIITILSQLREFNDKKNTMDELHDKTIAVLPSYRDEKTDFMLISHEKEIYDQIVLISKTVTNLMQIHNQVNNESQQLTQLFESFYHGLDTDWNHILDCLNWCQSFKSASPYNLSQITQFLEGLQSDSFVSECRQYQKTIQKDCQGLGSMYQWFDQLFDQKGSFTALNFETVKTSCKNLYDNIPALDEWIDYKRIITECKKQSLNEYLEVIKEKKIRPDQFVSVFQKRFYRLWLDAALEQLPHLASFRKLSQEKQIEEFRRIDKKQFEIASERIQNKLIRRLPSEQEIFHANNEMKVLRHEIGKKRRLIPIRQLFQKMPNLLMQLKPCLMMSPLSVSLYLESFSFQFDTVIFDEASQVFTENAIGAISRGKQVIIAGDSKQLPPTSFFAATTSDNDYDNDEDFEDDSYESVLDEANLLPTKTLLWHYRSRNEQLIAFSNAKIYNHNLITFPSSIDAAPDFGVEYTYVKNGFYDRGGKKGNYLEAKTVANMVFDHFRHFPNRSLGVITFGSAQQQAIETEIRKMRENNHDFESYFMEDKDEPFFVKSLENVQGDERDTIIFSIGYAKDKTGVMRMNFGPLSMTGGERRLNVAITRAKYNIKLVGSIVPEDIDLSKISSEGPKLLRSYIEFAKNGTSVIDPTIGRQNSRDSVNGFEDAVYKVLVENGYQVERNIGCSSYRVDLAVKDINGNYAVGIECDGKNYANAKTARERDRLRQEVMNHMGWQMYHVWSSNWIKDPKKEKQELLSFVKDVLSKIKKIEYPKRESTVVNEVIPDELRTSLSTVTKKKSTHTTVTPVKNTDVNKSTFPILPINQMKPIQNDPYEIRSAIYSMITALFPIHVEYLNELLATRLGLNHVSNEVKSAVQDALESLSNHVYHENDFYYPVSISYEDIRAIQHFQLGTRKISYLSAQEVASGLLEVYEKNKGALKFVLIERTKNQFIIPNSEFLSFEILANQALEILMKHNYIPAGTYQIAKYKVKKVEPKPVEQKVEQRVETQEVLTNDIAVIQEHERDLEIWEKIFLLMRKDQKYTAKDIVYILETKFGKKNVTLKYASNYMEMLLEAGLIVREIHNLTTTYERIYLTRNDKVVTDNVFEPWKNIVAFMSKGRMYSAQEIGDKFSISKTVANALLIKAKTQDNLVKEVPSGSMDNHWYFVRI